MSHHEWPEPFDPGPEDNPTLGTAPALLAKVRSGAWLDAQVFPPLAWAVPQVIPEGFGLFTGPPKAGKSWATLGIALAVASGGAALGSIATGPARPVLLLALEDGERRLQGRCRTLLGEGASIPERLDYVTHLEGKDAVPLIDAWLEEHGSERPLVILDTLGKVMPPAHPGEGAYQRDYRVGSHLKRSVDAHPGACLLVVHHVRKASADDWMDSTSGTNGLNGAADWTVNISRARNEEAGLLRVTGRDVPENEYAITCHEGTWTLDGHDLADAARTAQTTRATATLGDTSTRVYDAVQEAPDGITPAAVKGALPDVPSNTVDQNLRRLNEAGRIQKTGRGKYAPIPTPYVPPSQVSGVSEVSGVPPDNF